MLRNNNVLNKMIGSNLNNNKKSNSFDYPKLTDFTNNDEIDDYDGLEDDVTDVANIQNKNERNKVYYRGLCKLNMSYPSFNKASVLYYKIKIINNFPVLFFKLYNKNDKLQFHKTSQSLNDDASFMGHFTMNNQIFLFYNVDDYENPHELIENKYYWVTPSEIMNRQRVFHFPFDNEVHELFLKHKDFLYIETEEKKAFESPEVGYQNNISNLQFMLGPIMSKIDNHYQYDYTSRVKTNVGRDLILKIDTFTSNDTFGIRNLNQRLPLAYLSV